MWKTMIERQVFPRLFVYAGSRYSSNHSWPSPQKDSIENPDFVERILKKHPKITQANIDGFYQNFKEYALPVEIIPNILKRCPELVKIPYEKCNDIIKFWLDINLGAEFIELISMNPSVLYLSRKHVEIRYGVLVEIFGRKPVGKIFINSPLVLTEPVENIKLKVDYLENELKYSKNEIIKTGALNCAFEKIKLRFEFLRKAGGFKVPRPKTLIADKMANPQLTKILFLNNHDFANQIAGVSLLEFRVFQELMSSEEDSDYENVIETS